MTPRYVQHSSGQGPHWEVTTDTASAWFVRHVCGDHFILPKSDYHLLPPPEVWTDVTAQCEFVNDLYWVMPSGHRLPIFCLDGKIRDGFRLRKVHLILRDGPQIREAFVIEHLEAP